ncbi:MAG: thiamine diphosphokinase [Defluviitaleaceae bacterium]|nr:thiamine diphosphokinase [Defluviitaleaceae bacterium]
MTMPICHIIGAGDFFAENLYPRVDGDLIIAADGGLKRLSEIGISPDFAIGDFDSCPTPEPDSRFQIIRLEPEKDDTDMLCSIRFGCGKGFRVFHIHGGTGGRPDHTFANIQCLAYLAKKSASGFLFFQNFVMTAISDCEMQIEGNPGDYISVFAYGGKASGVTLSGLKYPLSDAVLSDDYPLGVSNEFTAQPARISVACGMLLISCPVNAKIY